MPEAGMGDWTAALTGGLAGAVITQLVQWGLSVYRAPAFELKFGEEIPGVIVKDVEYTEKDSGYRGKQRYYRLRVDNIGNAAATDVEVLVERVANGGRWEFQDEVLSLLWSNSKDSVKVSIPSKTFRFVDLLVSDNDQNRHSPSLLAERYDFARFRDSGLDGVLEIDVCVTASNANTIRKTLRLSSQSDNHLRIVMGH